MTIIDSELLKGCRGKFNDFIFYQYRGKTCLRAKPEKKRKIFPAEMVRQRERIAGVAALYQGVKAAGMFRIWTQAAEGTGLTGYNLFVQRNVPAFTGEGEVGDFGKVCLSVGPLQLPDRMAIGPGGEDEWILEWDNTIEYPGTDEEDRLMIALLSQKDGFSVKVPVIGDYCRKYCRAVVCLPSMWRGYVCLYCYFCSARGSEFSESFCFLLSN